MTKALPNIHTSFSEWYNEVLQSAELADLAPVRGCIVIRPYGYAIWEFIQQDLDSRIKRTGHQNAAFPLFIPESFLKREAQHVAGFSPELAIVTHAGGKELEEPLVVRPTSETIIHYMFAKWMRSYRELPFKINQWANVVRWEMRTRPFLRTTEFWWQEGHTAHETEEEAHREVFTMLEEYRSLAENLLAIPVVTGKKTNKEKFAGADFTMTFEGLMPDGKALQMGTSHAISQSFAHAFDMKFQNRVGGLSYPYLTSWGSTTRLVGALIMTHGDQKGLVLPPRVAPIQIVIVPIPKSGSVSEILSLAQNLEKELSGRFRVKLDHDEHLTAGAKFFHWELRGVPLRIEVGARDLVTNTLTIVERVTGKKTSHNRDSIVSACGKLLEESQAKLFTKAKEQLHSQWHKVDTYNEIEESLERRRGFCETVWCGSEECEMRLASLKASIRCLLDKEVEQKTCFSCKKTGAHIALIAVAY